VDAALAKQYEQEKTETKNFEINLSQSHSWARNPRRIEMGLNPDRRLTT
jgi:hypothetical protein